MQCKEKLIKKNFQRKKMLKKLPDQVSFLSLFAGLLHYTMRNR